MKAKKQKYMKRSKPFEIVSLINGIKYTFVYGVGVYNDLGDKIA